MRRWGILLPLMAAACEIASGSKEEVLAGVSPDRVLEAARQVAVEEGFTMEKSAAGSPVLTTEWKASMSLGYRDGTRRRFRVEARPSDGGTALSVQCAHEVNETMGQPLNPERAKWNCAGRDDAAEDLLTMRIKMKLERLAVEWHD